MTAAGVGRGVSDDIVRTRDRGLAGNSNPLCTRIRVLSYVVFYANVSLVAGGVGAAKGGLETPPFIAWINPGIDREPGPTA